MKKLFFTLSLGVFSLAAMAQQQSPTLMRIAGKPISRAEFEYAYNKNNGVEGAVEKKSISEYLDMFINYKLKVAAAEALQMDTLKSFQDEFRTYRDLQLTPTLKNPAFIDTMKGILKLCRFFSKRLNPNTQFFADVSEEYLGHMKIINSI